MPSRASVLNEFHIVFPSHRQRKTSNRNERPGAGPGRYWLRGDDPPEPPRARPPPRAGDRPGVWPGVATVAARRVRHISWAEAHSDRPDTDRSENPRGGRHGRSSGDRLRRVGGAVRRHVRVGGPGPEPFQRQRADAQRRLPGHHALPVRAVGPVRAVAVGRLAYLRPRLALPAPRVTAIPVAAARGPGRRT